MKKAKALFVLMAVLFSLTVPVLSVLAEDSSQTEYEWTVTVSYKIGTKIHQVTYHIWAVSSREAEAKAQAKCEYEKSANVVSCGAAIATGRSKSL